MLRFATKQTSRVLLRSRTIPRVAQSVRQHSAGVTEGALGVLPQLAIMGCVVGIGSSIWGKPSSDNKSIEIKQEEIERESAEARQKNTDQMSDKWSAIAPSREAVLHKRYNSNGNFNLRKLLGMANKSEVNQTTPVPDSVADVIQFFLRWKQYHNKKTIDSADLKQLLGSDFITFHSILSEILDDEAKGWHQIDSDNLKEVVDFLDKISKMEMDG